MTGYLFISFRPTDRPYVERLHAYLTERGVTAWFDDAVQPAQVLDQTVLDRIEQARAVVAVGDAAGTAGEPARAAEEVAYARKLGKAVHEIAPATVESGWLPGDDFIAEVGGAIAAGAMSSASMYGDAADLVLDNSGDRILAAIKTVRELTGAGLREARVLVDSAPTVVLQGVRKHLAEAVAERLTLEGVAVRVVPAGTAREAAVLAETVDAEALATAMGKLYEVLVEQSGPNKIKVVATVRRHTDLGLKEIKDLVEAVPQVVMSGVSWSQAQQAAVELRQVGAKVTVR